MSDLLRILAAPAAWLASFSAIYGLHGLLCGLPVEAAAPGAIEGSRLLLIGAAALALGLQAVLLALLHAPRFDPGSGFVRFVSRTTGWVGLVATGWTMLPILAASSCG